MWFASLRSHPSGKNKGAATLHPTDEDLSAGTRGVGAPGLQCLSGFYGTAEAVPLQSSWLVQLKPCLFKTMVQQMPGLLMLDAVGARESRRTRLARGFGR
jgi:hypothetical protein